jgi:hypothetical protein
VLGAYRAWRLEGFASQTPKSLNRPKILLRHNHTPKQRKQVEFVVYNLTLVILEVFEISKHFGGKNPPLVFRQG